MLCWHCYVWTMGAATCSSKSICKTSRHERYRRISRLNTAYQIYTNQHERCQRINTTQPLRGASMTSQTPPIHQQFYYTTWEMNLHMTRQHMYTETVPQTANGGISIISERTYLECERTRVLPVWKQNQRTMGGAPGAWYVGWERMVQPLTQGF